MSSPVALSFQMNSDSRWALLLTEAPVTADDIPHVGLFNVNGVCCCLSWLGHLGFGHIGALAYINI